MKTLAIILAVVATSAPAYAVSFSVGSLTPSMTFPEPVEDSGTVSKNVVSEDN